MTWFLLVWKVSHERKVYIYIFSNCSYSATFHYFVTFLSILTIIKSEIHNFVGRGICTVTVWIKTLFSIKTCYDFSFIFLKDWKAINICLSSWLTFKVLGNSNNLSTNVIFFTPIKVFLDKILHCHIRWNRL